MLFVIRGWVHAIHSSDSQSILAQTSPGGAVSSWIVLIHLEWNPSYTEPICKKAFLLKGYFNSLHNTSMTKDYWHWVGFKNFLWTLRFCAQKCVEGVELKFHWQTIVKETDSLKKDGLSNLYKVYII